MRTDDTGTIRLPVLEVEVPRALLAFLAEHGLNDEDAIVWVKMWDWRHHQNEHVVAYPDGPRLRDHRPDGLPAYDGPLPTMVRP